MQDNERKYITVVSPVNGVISDVDSRNGLIQIYISPTDNHTIYAPMTGRITNITHENGSWTKQVFQAYEEKTARVTIEIDGIMEFWLEVGKPTYITDRIRITKNVGDSIVQGEIIGEILLGSLSEVHLLNRQFSVPNNVYVTKRVQGGVTVLAGYKRINNV